MTISRVLPHISIQEAIIVMKDKLLSKMGKLISFICLSLLGILLSNFSPLIVFIIFILFFIFAITFLIGEGRNFFNLQRTLPTSRIRSIANGLVEIKGKVIPISLKKAPMNRKPCVAYCYTIDRISKNKEGRTTYTEIHRETVCDDFYIDDGTDKALIRSEGIEFTKLKLDHSEKIDSKRFSQYLLLPNTEVFVIGHAIKENGEAVIIKDENKQIFSLSSSAAVETSNLYRPLKVSAAVVAFITALLIGFVLTLPIKIENDKIRIQISSKNIATELGF